MPVQPFCSSENAIQKVSGRRARYFRTFYILAIFLMIIVALRVKPSYLSGAHGYRNSAVNLGGGGGGGGGEGGMEGPRFKFFYQLSDHLPTA